MRTAALLPVVVVVLLLLAPHARADDAPPPPELPDGAPALECKEALRVLTAPGDAYTGVLDCDGARDVLRLRWGSRTDVLPVQDVATVERGHAHPGTGALLGAVIGSGVYSYEPVYARR